MEVKGRSVRGGKKRLDPIIPDEKKKNWRGAGLGGVEGVHNTFQP